MSVPFLNVKPHAFKIKVQVRFPANVNGGIAIDVFKLNGSYTINWNLSELVPTAVIADPPNSYFGYWNSITGIYNTVSATNLLAEVGIVPSHAWTLRGNPSAATAFATDFTIASLADKVVPVGADKIMVQDSTDNSLKDVNLSTLPQSFPVAASWTLRGNPTGGPALVSDFTIGSLANKALPVNADRIAIQDSVDGSLKNILLSAITAALTAQPAWTLWGNPTNAPATQVSFTIDGLALKSVPVGADEVMIADSAAGFGYKKTPIFALPNGFNQPPAQTLRGNPTGAVAPYTDFTITSLTGKAVPIAADQVMIEDSTTTPPSLKKASLTSLSNKLTPMVAWALKGNPTAASALPSDFNIGSLVAKASPDAADNLLLEDNVASGALKKVSWASLPGSTGGAPATNPPLMDGVAAVGVAVKWAREDHVHPFDTSRAPFADAMAYSGMQINGAIDFDQINSYASTNLPSVSYICDGWLGIKTGTMVAAGQNVADAPPGYTNSIKVTISTAQGSMGAGDVLAVYQPIEGTRVMRCQFGKASAVPISVAFWVKAHRPGTYSVSLRNLGNGTATRSYAALYTVNVADTWEFKTVTIPGCVDGTWVTNVNTGMALAFTIACGSAYLTSLTTWMAGNFWAGIGQVNGVAATTDTFQITGVLILPGVETPTAAKAPFAMRSIPFELPILQRYWWKNVQSNDDFFGALRYNPIDPNDNVEIFYPVQMRVVGTISVTWEDATAGTQIRAGYRSCWLRSTNTAGGHYVNNISVNALLT